MNLLESAKQRYLQMFSGLPQEEFIRDAIKNAMTFALSVLKRQDRIVWYLRWVRADIDFRLMQQNRGTPVGKKFEDRWNAFMKYMNTNVISYQGQSRWVLSERFITQITHYLSMPIVEITNTVWEKQSPHGLLDAFQLSEEKWKASRDQFIDMSDDEQAELIMEFPDGFAWFNLNRPYCEKEGSAMGHCGNTAARDGTVLSLRHKSTAPGHETRWRPVATFILHDGILGEMKGRANKKPEKRYHPYIVALLKHDIITGIKGGGHDPRQNFSINDLDDAQKDELLADKPGLAGVDVRGMYEKEGGFTDNVIEVIGNLVDEHLRGNSNIIPYDWAEHEETLPNGETSKSLFVHHIGDWEDYVKEVGNFIPMVKDLAELLDEAQDGDISEVLKKRKSPHRHIDEDFLREFYNSLSPSAKKWVSERLRITSKNSAARVKEVVNRVHQAMDAEFTEYFDEAFKVVSGEIDVSLFEPEKIRERIDRYLDAAAYYGNTSYYAGIVKDEDKGDYYVSISSDHYINLVSVLSEDDWEESEEGSQIYEITRFNWFSSEYVNEQRSDSLPEALNHLISVREEKSDFRRYDLSSYEDDEYGKYFEDIDEAIFDTDAAKIAHVFEEFLNHQRSPRDSSTKDMFEDIRRLAGIR